MFAKVSIVFAADDNTICVEEGIVLGAIEGIRA